MCPVNHLSILLLAWQTWQCGDRLPYLWLTELKHTTPVWESAGKICPSLLISEQFLLHPELQLWLKHRWKKPARYQHKKPTYALSIWEIWNTDTCLIPTLMLPYSWCYPLFMCRKVYWAQNPAIVKWKKHLLDVFMVLFACVRVLCS